MLFPLLTGGEPLLHPQFSEIYTGLLDLGLQVSINSNGTYSLCRFDWNHAMILDPHVSYPPTPKKIWDSITLWQFQQRFLEKNRKLLTVLSCPKCGILKQGVPEDLDDFAEEILDRM